eukprot:1996688-Rhodomonas_salina.1
MSTLRLNQGHFKSSQHAVHALGIKCFGHAVRFRRGAGTRAAKSIRFRYVSGTNCTGSRLKCI